MNFYAQLSSIPFARAALYDDPALIKKYPYLPVLKKAILTAQPRPQLVRYGDATAAIQDAAYDAERGAKSPEQALSDLQAKLMQIATEQTRPAPSRSVGHHSPGSPVMKEQR